MCAWIGCCICPMPEPREIEMVRADTLRLRTEVWRRYCSRSGAMTLAEKSRLLGLDIGTISRIERGSAPSAKFIARAITALTQATFDELFETVRAAA